MFRPLLLALFAVGPLISPKPAQAVEASETPGAVCDLEEGDFYRLLTDPAPTRQGAVIAMNIVSGGGHDSAWGGPVANACARDWQLSDPAVTLSPDFKSFIISGDARPGARVRISARIANTTIATEFVIVGKDAVVPTGYWTEVGDAACPASQPVLREFALLADGTFKATWMPFETYVDYWGTYSFDQATGAISLTPTDGNYIPTDADLVGVANLDAGGDLLVTGMFFGTRRDSEPSAPQLQGCSLRFKRR